MGPSTKPSRFCYLWIHLLHLSQLALDTDKNEHAGDIHITEDNLKKGVSDMTFGCPLDPLGTGTSFANNLSHCTHS